MNNLNTIAYIVMVTIIGYLLINPKIEYVPIEYEVVKTDTTEVVKVDTVFVKDTVYVELDIPEPIKEDSLNVYRTSHIDQYITAYITSRVYGELIGQDFTYIRNYERVTIDRIVHIDRYLQPTRTFIPPQNHTSLGIGTTAILHDNKLHLIPNIYLQDKGVIYRVGYNPLTGIIEGGINIQIFGK